MKNIVLMLEKIIVEFKKYFKLSFYLLRSHILMIFLLTLLSGCVSQKNLSNADNNPSLAYDEQQKWWQEFKDPLIDELVSILLKQNIDLKIAYERIEEARALSSAANAKLLPEFNLKLSSSQTNKDLGFTQATTQFGIDSSWELDLFQANNLSANASEKRLEALKTNASDVRRIVTSDLIKAIIELRQAQKKLGVIKNLVANDADIVNILNSKFQAGLIPANKFEEMISKFNRDDAQIATTQSLIKQLQYQIELLLGQKPNTIDDVIAKHSNIILTLPLAKKTFDITIDNIKKRPDVRNSEFALMASNLDLKAAKADLFPKISIANFFGIKENSNDKAVQISNPIWSIAGSITAPIINFNKLKANIAASDSAAQKAALEYENKVLGAMKEVNAFLSEYLNNVNIVNQQKLSIEHYNQVVDLAQERFDSGLSDMIELSQVKIELANLNIDLSDKEMKMATSYIKLQKALTF